MGAGIESWPVKCAAHAIPSESNAIFILRTLAILSPLCRYRIQDSLHP